MLAPNTVLRQRYLIVSAVGKGGQGTVYQAVDQHLARTVAIKEVALPPPDVPNAAQAQEHSSHEARMLARFYHPALPVVHDIFSDQHSQFVVMQFIPGKNLAELLEERETAFPIGDVLRWAYELIDVLDYLHIVEHIYHRDIKPNNIKQTVRGNVMLLDFGLAKLGAKTVAYGYTPYFTSLEQENYAHTDSASDIYSLCATLYCLATRSTPPDAKNDRLDSIASGHPDPLRLASEINADVFVEVAAVLHRGMALDRKDRISTAPALKLELDRALAGRFDNPSMVQESKPSFTGSGASGKMLEQKGMLEGLRGALFNK